MAASDSTSTFYNWIDTEFVRKHLSDIAQYVSATYIDHMQRRYSRTSLESPLEVIFAIMWNAMEMCGDIHSDSVSFTGQHEIVTSSGRRYRLDFLLHPGEPLHGRAKSAGVPIPRIGVELDGHDFHERTKEQVAYRNQRDRDLQADGWTVLHFSGSELNRDPWKCVNEAFSHAYRAFGWDFEMLVIDAEQKAERA
jgi:hypothetical protein